MGKERWWLRAAIYVALAALVRRRLRPKPELHACPRALVYMDPRINKLTIFVPGGPGLITFLESSVSYTQYLY